MLLRDERRDENAPDEVTLTTADAAILIIAIGNADYPTDQGLGSNAAGIQENRP